MGFAYSIPTAPFLPPASQPKDWSVRFRHLGVDGQRHLGSPSSLWVIRKGFWDKTKWLTALFEVDHQAADDSPIVSCAHWYREAWEHVGQSAVQQISWSTFKCRYDCRGQSITIYCFKKEYVA